MHAPHLVFSIDSACLGGMLLWVYTGLVVAEPNLTNKQRIQGIVLGLVILVAFNFLRIFMSIYLEWPTGFRVHTLFYFFNMIFVLLVWAGWLWTLRHGTINFVKRIA
jgi:exosortase/archaeosortase family protein